MDAKARWGIAAAVGIAVLGLGAAPAGAANLDKSGGDLLYTGSATENFNVTLTIPSAGNVLFDGDDPLTLGASTGCTLAANGQDATCSTSGITQLDIDTLDAS